MDPVDPNSGHGAPASPFAFRVHGAFAGAARWFAVCAGLSLVQCSDVGDELYTDESNLFPDVGDPADVDGSFRDDARKGGGLVDVAGDRRATDSQDPQDSFAGDGGGAHETGVAVGSGGGGQLNVGGGEDVAAGGAAGSSGSPDGSGGLPDAAPSDALAVDVAARDVSVSDALSDAGDAQTRDVALDQSTTADVVEASHPPDASDAGLADRGADSTSVDSGGEDSGADMVCAVNNGGAPCTPTQELFVRKSLDCYQCLIGAGCLNDTLYSSDVGHECADVSATAPTLHGTEPNQACLATLSCVLTHGCAVDSPSDCFCGTAHGTACLTAGAANGPCKAENSDGLNVPDSDPTSTLKAFTDTARPAGQANAIFTCAEANLCSVCLQ